MRLIEYVDCGKALRSADFIAALPHGPIGKVLKKTLRKPYGAGRERKI